MGVDQEWRAVVVAVGREPGQVDFFRLFERKRVDIGHRLKIVIDGGNVDIADVQQQSAARTRRYLAEKVRLAH